MQVWISTQDHRRLLSAAKVTGRSLSSLAREGLLRVLDEIEKIEKERVQSERFFRQFSNPARKFVLLARHEAELQSAQLVGSQHLLLALATDDKFGKLFTKYGAPFPVIVATMEKNPGLCASYYTQIVSEPYSPRFIRIMDRARITAKRLLDRYAQPEHLFLSLLDQGTGAAYNLLEYIGFQREEARAALMKGLPSYRRERRWKRKGN